MRRSGLFLLLVVLAAAAPASAQTKTSGKVHCAKADPDYTIEVGDQPGHVLGVHKAACTWSDATPIGGVMLKSGEDVATQEVNGTMGHDSGYHVATMDNGDKMVVKFTGAATIAKDKPVTLDGKWTFVSGTGKLKGLKGGGTYKGVANADGSSEVTIEGTYTLPKSTGSDKK